MKIFDYYLLKNLSIATFFIAIILTLIIFLTQSLKFLEIVIEAGTSSSTFWVLTALALPRFFEVILPLAIMSATLFLYNKMTMDSELIAVRASGQSSFGLARPLIILGSLVMLVLWIVTMWVAPLTVSKMQQMQNVLKSELSSILFKEGVFNAVGPGLTVYIAQKQENGNLAGLMIHDTRNTAKPPATILAKRGMMISGEQGNQVVVFDGTQQEYNPENSILQKLTFDRYTIDLPESGTARKRWAEPDERTMLQLLNPNKDNVRDIENIRQFSIEIHRRITSPVLALTLPLVALTFLLIGPIHRRGQNEKIMLGVISAIIIQGLFLTSYNLAQKHNAGLAFMYLLTFAPLCMSLFLLSQHGEAFRRALLYRQKPMQTGEAST